MASDNKTRKHRFIYAFGDWIMSNVAVFLYNIFRYYINPEISLQQGFRSLEMFLTSNMVVVGQIFFPIAMLAIYWLSGYYNNVFRKSLLQEFATTILSTAMCTLLMFFVALINDAVRDHYHNYEMLVVLWGILFICIYPVRLLETFRMKRLIARSQIEFATLIVGCNDKARNFVKELKKLKAKLGYKVVGYVATKNEVKQPDMPDDLPIYNFGDIKEACQRENVTDLILVLQERNMDDTLNTLNRLYPLNLPIKVLSDDIDPILTRGKLDTVHGTPLIDISCSNMTECETNLKRTADIFFSAIALVLLSPLFAIIAITIKMVDRGPVIYKQERIGLHGKPFTIYKFRTMTINAERDGKPRLTAANDDRVFPFGHFLRKYRLDELLQFWNVLRGDMSIVGPRPERQYFIDRIIERAPHYTLLLQVRPGITSLGMVKYGYASNIEGMIERMKYDIIYIENISLITDLKIAFYTIWTVVTGKGL